MVRFAVAVGWSAFLLFQVQPLIGTAILPWFGGTPAVWTTCLLFFQAALLAGYAYAHGIVSRLTPREQAWCHLAVLGCTLCWLPLTLAIDWKPTGTEQPAWAILGLLVATVGGPYFALSATGPLLQGWFHLQSPQASPYRLYALSNAGSLVALLSYPFLIQPFLSVRWQLWIWSLGYLLFVVCCVVCAWPLLSLREAVAKKTQKIEAEIPAPAWGDRVLWLCLAACGSLLLSATTSQMCQDVAVVSFLWVLPLAIYLVSFILCFDHADWYSRPWYTFALGIGLAQTLMVLVVSVELNVFLVLGAYLLTLLICCMICHGELVRLKPHPKYLTQFYVYIAAGGALGGGFVALVAPQIFNGYWEFQFGLILCCTLLLICALRDPKSLFNQPRSLAWKLLAGGGLVLVTTLLALQMMRTQDGVIFACRNFFGVKRVQDVMLENADGKHPIRFLIHGGIEHGNQWQDPAERHQPTSYYAADSGIGLALELHPKREALDPAEQRLRIGVVGLGTGTVAALVQAGDHLTFYEIDPQVIALSQPQGKQPPYFTYLADSAAHARGGSLNIVLGDARLSLEKELKSQQPRYDILAIDAFSSDAIPVHLLTRECFEIYLNRLSEDGILAIHISNRNLDLGPVVLGLAQQFGCQAVSLLSTSEEHASYEAAWVLVTRNKAFANHYDLQSYQQPWPVTLTHPPVWTDDHANLWDVLIWPTWKKTE